MITSSQRKKLKKLLSTDYVSEVLEVLKKKGVTSKNNTEYSESTIRMIFNGHRENVDIEDAILEVYDTRKKEQQEREKRKSDLLSA